MVACREWTQFSSVQSLDRLGRRGNMMDNLAEILSQSFLFFCFLREAIVSSSCKGRDVHSFMLSIQQFLCRPRRRPSPPPPPTRCPEGWFRRGCRGVWHPRSRQTSVSWQLPAEVPVDPQGSWSCSAPSCCLVLQVGDTEWSRSC